MCTLAIRKHKENTFASRFNFFFGFGASCYKKMEFGENGKNYRHYQKVHRKNRSISLQVNLKSKTPYGSVLFFLIL